MDILIYILIFLFIILEAYFSGTETAIISANVLKLQPLQENKKIKKILNYIEDKNKTLSTLLVGTNLAIVGATSLTSMVFIRKYGAYGEYYATITMTLIILIFGEILPKAIFRKIANSILRKTIILLNIFYTLFTPIIDFILFIIHFIPGFKKFQKRGSDIFLTREDIKNIFNIGEKQGLFEGLNRDMIYSIFDFSATYVREIMVPLVDIIVIKKDKKVEDVIRLSEKFGYTRVPVYDEHVYNIIGYIHVLDLFKAKAHDPLQKFIKPAYYVPETKKIDNLFLEINNKNLSMVFIVDEYGGVSGMVTREDIVEEIVGEIGQKPLEIDKEKINKTNVNEWTLSGDYNLDELYDKIGLSLPKKGFETIAGFIEYNLGKIPRKNEKFIYNNFEFKVTQVSTMTILAVKIKKLKTHVIG